jgi:hypothetical protein
MEGGTDFHDDLRYSKTPAWVLSGSQDRCWRLGSIQGDPQLCVSDGQVF